jgi:hypothetical protein
LLGAAAWGVVTLVFAARAYADLRALEGLARQPRAQLDWAAAQRVVRAARGDTGALRAVAAPVLWLTPALGWIPGVGADLRQADALLQLAAQLAAAGDESLSAALPLLQSVESAGASGELLPALLAQWPAADPHLAAAEGALELAAAARARLAPGELSPAQQRRVALVDQWLPPLLGAVTLARTLPGWLGADAPQSYLLLAQNQDELRGTGGFISGAGVLTLDRGQISELEIRDAYALDDFTRGPYPAPPAALSRYMGSRLWVLRDANWSPDFPSSAQTAAALYALGQGRSVEGVIAFDQTFLQSVLGATGPVPVAGTAELVSADNVVAYMRRAWSAQPEAGASAEWFAQRKDFMAALGQALASRVLSLRQPDELAGLAGALFTSLNERHLLLYARDSERAALLARLGWDGSVRPGPGDYWMWVDSNVGFNKVNAQVQVNVQYAVDLSNPAKPRASLTAQYRNNASAAVACRPGADDGSGQYAALTQRCYWDYWRLLVPPGAALLSATPNNVPASELLTQTAEHNPVAAQPGEAGTTLFAGLFVLAPQAEQRVALTYQMPPAVLTVIDEHTRRYQLRVQKQSGTAAVPLQMTLRFPADWKVAAMEPAAAVSPGLLAFSLSLRTDAEVSVLFTTP